MLRLRVRHRHFLPARLGVSAIVLYPYVLLSAPRGDPSVHVDSDLVRHEMIHVRQIRAQGAWRFYLGYLLHYVRGRWAGRTHDAAYRAIPAEREAYAYAQDRALSSAERREWLAAQDTDDAVTSESGSLNAGSTSPWEEKIHREIPLSRAMQMTLVEATLERVRWAAPLEPNRNHLGTGFGGSLYCASALTCYTLLLQRVSPTAEVVIGEGKIRYRRAVTRAFEVTALETVELRELPERLARTGKAHFRLRAELREQESESVCAEFEGEYFVREPAFKALDPHGGVRRATTADNAALVKLVNGAYRGEAALEGWTTEAGMLGGQRVDPAGMQELLTQPNGAVLALSDAEGILACVHLQRTADGGAYLGMLTVRPAAQARGTGRQLLAAAEAFAQSEWRASYIEMTVIAQRRSLIEWYERRGYRDTQERRPFPLHDERFGLAIEGNSPTSLEFTVLRKEWRVGSWAGRAEPNADL